VVILPSAGKERQATRSRRIHPKLMDFFTAQSAVHSGMLRKECPEIFVAFSAVSVLSG